MNLTDLKIRALPFQHSQRDYPDNAVAGMFLRVGKKTKTFMLTIRRSTRERITIGLYPDLSLSKARERARDLLAEARLAKDQPVTMTLRPPSSCSKPSTSPRCAPVRRSKRRAFSRRAFARSAIAS